MDLFCNMSTSGSSIHHHKTKNRALHSVALLLFLCVNWLLWSGHFNDPLLLSFGAGSCLFVLFLCRRMQIVDEEGAPVQLGIRPYLYAPWLIKEIIVANIDVARRVLSPSLPINPKVFFVKTQQKTDVGRVIFANSITLTPGTVSIDVQGNSIEVHALTGGMADEDQTDEMNRRVARIEG